MSMTITNVDPNNGIMKEGKFQDILLTAAGATTFKVNTLLALDDVSLKAVPYVKGGSTNDNGTPRFLLRNEVVAAGAGDLAVRVMLTGEVSTQRCVIHADGDATNIDNTVKALCKDQGLVLVDATDLGVLDNQP